MADKLEELKSALEKVDTAELGEKPKSEETLESILENLSTIDLSSLSTISSMNTANNYYSTAGLNGYQNITINSGGTSNSYTYTSPFTTSYTSDNNLTVSGDADFQGDVKIKGHSIVKLLEKMEDRLAVLMNPDPEKLERFAALKKAYDHYKLMERLCQEDPDAESK